LLELHHSLKRLAGGSRALRKAFSDVDLDGNGHLDYYELCQALKVLSFFGNAELVFHNHHELTPSAGIQY
jgi:Ca2+-binding EF-hand superfamily protein